MSNITSKFMDELEQALIIMIKIHFKEAGHPLTDEEARNLLAKVGSRIMFSSEIYDAAVGVKQ